MRNEKITPLYERLSRDDELQGGTILTRKEFITEKDGYVQIDEYGFEDSMTLEEWLEENN